MEYELMDNSQFFYRIAPFSSKEGRVALVDILNIDNTTPLDDWLGLVVSLADGFHTLQQLIDHLSAQYSTPPDNLEKTIYSVVERLVESKVIELSQRVTTLPYYLSGPVDELDMERARRELALQDGQPDG
ncbi:hypothetical protein A3740_15940, partial [Oleiphilus sp. HI0068]